MFEYRLLPIDRGWEFLPTVDEFAEKVSKMELEAYKRGEELLCTVKDFYLSLECAEKRAINMGWEGDVRGSKHVFLVPCGDEIGFGFVWKQENNGTTFVLSPTVLPDLDDSEC